VLDQSRLELDQLSYAVNGRTILADVSLRLQPGEMLGLVGPNGAGKTTLLRAISGALAPAKGWVRIDATPLERLDASAIARIVAQVPQSTTIDFGFSCLEVVLMGRHPHLGRFSQEGPADYRLAEAAMAFTGTLDLAGRLVTEVSGGERQRVVAARALAQQPRVLLLDEPTANLDVYHRLLLLELVQALAKEQRVSVVAAIHDLELAARFCDRLVLLKAGRMLASGAPELVLTPERIFEAFGARALVRTEPLTGALDILMLPNRGSIAGNAERIHVIAGGGSGARIMYLLHAAGYRVSVGVLAQNDTDYEAARLLGLEVVAVPPFCQIDTSAGRRNTALIERSACVVVCATPFGRDNLANLAAAAAARALVVIDAQNGQARDHTGGQAAALLHHIAARAIDSDASGVVGAVQMALGRHSALK
jgi:iron complex transport system ATP-binding protein